jgi:hypothetical protein
VSWLDSLTVTRGLITEGFTCLRKDDIRRDLRLKADVSDLQGVFKLADNRSLSTMKFLLLTSLFTQLFWLGAAQFDPPPTSTDPSTIKDCSWWFVAEASDTCDGIAAAYGVPKAQLVSYVSPPLFGLQYLTAWLILESIE